MTLQDKQKTRHRRPKIHSVPSPIPEWDEPRRFHWRVQCRIYGWPLWIKLILVLAAGTGLVLAGATWSGGRSSVLAEQLAERQSQIADVSTEAAALKERVSALEAELAAAPDPGTIRELESERELARERVAELDEAILGWQGEVSQLQDEIESLNRQLRVSEYRLDAQRNLTVTAESELAAEVAKIPEAVADALHSAELGVEAEHFIGVEWRIERRWFGGSNDENHQFRNSHGEVEYRSLPTPRASYWDEDVVVIGLGLPHVSDEPSFKLKATDLQPNSGFVVDLARFFGQDTNLQPLLAEADHRLNELACSDLESLKLFTDKALETAEAAARGYEVRLRWRDLGGFYHTEISDQLLLDNAC